MNLPYRPSKYTIRAPPPIPPRPESLPNPGNFPPALPPRPLFPSEGYHPPPQTQPAPYDPAAHTALPVPGPLPQPPQVYYHSQYAYSPGPSGHYDRGQQNERTPPPPPPPPRQLPAQHEGFPPKNDHVPVPYTAPSTYQPPAPADTVPVLSFNPPPMTAPFNQHIPSYATTPVRYSQESTAAYSQPPNPPISEPIHPLQAQSTEMFTSDNVPFYNSHVPRDRSSDPLTPPPLFSQERKQSNPISTTSLKREPASTSQRSQPQTKPPTVRLDIQYDPPEKFTLRDCPSTTFPLAGESLWYILPEVPDFRICSYCYNKHIQYSRFQTNFHPWTSPAGARAQCLFSTARIEEQMWPRALHSGNLQELKRFFKHRLTVRNCCGDRGVSASENVKWYQLRERSGLPQFVACEACYEDVLLASPLCEGFVVCAEAQTKESLWSCDMAAPYIRRLALKVSDSGRFSTDAARYLELPPCVKNGEMVDGRSRKWYQVRNSTSAVTVCERCYGEYAVRTDFEHKLEPVVQPQSQHQCILGLWQASCLWAEALERKDFSLWEDTMVEFVNTPPCTLQIAHGGKAYQIHGVDNFDLCRRCYVGLLKPHGLDRHFKQVQSSATTPRSCDLNASAARFASYAAKLDEAMITCTFATFINFAAGVCNLELCPRLDLVSGRMWYGGDGFRICPACYEEVVRGSDLARHFSAIPVAIPGEEHCDLYSVRMRGKWSEACEKRDPAIFTEFAAFRKTIYDQTVPEMRHIVAMAKLNLNMQRMYNVSSSFYNNMDGMSASMYNPHISYGAAGLHRRFDTPWGVHGAQLGNTAQGYGQGIMSDTARVGQLQAMWDQVE